MSFRCAHIPFLDEIISRHGVMLHVVTEMTSPKTRKDLQSFLDIMNYVSKFSLVTAEICSPLQWLTSAKTERTGTSHTRDYKKGTGTNHKRFMHEIL